MRSSRGMRIGACLVVGLFIGATLPSSVAAAPVAAPVARAVSQVLPADPIADAVPPSGVAGVPANDGSTPVRKDWHSPGQAAATPAVAGYSIQGTVTESGGGPLNGIYVEADSTTNSNFYVHSYTTGSGTYSLDGLPSDTYAIFFGDDSGVHYNGWFSGGGVPVARSSAAIVSVSGTVVGVNAQLAVIGSWTLTLQASASTAPVGSPVTITATTNHDILLTNFDVYIERDDDSGWYCTYGTTCYVSDWMSNAGSTTYHAILVSYLDGSTHLPSNSVTVTWTSLGGSTYVAMSPTRILDSRDGTGLTGAFKSHYARGFHVTGGTSGVPSTASAVTGNLTVTQQTSMGFLYIGPTLMDYPASSTLNFPQGDDRANAVTVALGNSGLLWITFAAPTLGPTAHVIFDITGYFSPTSGVGTYHAVTPKRLMDSRDGTGGVGIFRSHVAQHFSVAGGSTGVPTNATAVTGNLTVTQQTAMGFLYIGPAAMNNPTSSTLNFPLGDDRANAVTVQLAIGGSLWVTYAAPSIGPTAHVVFDITGYFTPDMTGSAFTPLTPKRLLDSRDGTGACSVFNSHLAQTFQVSGGSSGVPDNATAVTGNLTVTQQNRNGFLYVGPAPMNDPTSSTLNFPYGDDRANAVDVSLGSGGKLSVTYAAPVLGPIAHAIFDVTGYFAPYAAPPAVSLAITGLATSESVGVPDAGMVVTALDGRGNVATTYTGLVYFASSDPLATLPFEYQFTPADGGVHHFSAPDGVAFGSAGTFSVTAEDALSPSVARGVWPGIVVDGTPPTATFHSVSTLRRLDTRDGTGLSGAFQAGVARTFQVTGAGGIPTGAVAVTGNLWVTQQTQAGNLFIGAAPNNTPIISNLRFPVADDRAAAVATSLSATGTLSVTYIAVAGATTHVIFDITGYYTGDLTGTTFHSLLPTRVLDTSNGLGLSGTFSSHVARTFTVTGIPAAAVAVTGRLTVTQQTSLGFLFIGPVAADNPSSSNLNFPLGVPRGNSVAVALGTSQMLSVTYAAPTLGPTAHVVFDVTGYFAP